MELRVGAMAATPISENKRMAARLPLFINGKFVDSESNETLPVRDPATQETLAELPFASRKEIDQAVASAKEAFAVWRETPIPERARLMLRYQDLLKQHQNDIAKILSRETGKIFADAQGDVWRGIEVVEHACNIASLMMGETVENVAGRIEVLRREAVRTMRSNTRRSLTGSIP